MKILQRVILTDASSVAEGNTISVGSKVRLR